VIIFQPWYRARHFISVRHHADTLTEKRTVAAAALLRPKYHVHGTLIEVKQQIEVSAEAAPRARRFTHYTAAWTALVKIMCRVGRKNVAQSTNLEK